MESEYSKLLEMLSVYEKILHPDFFRVFKTQLHAAYEENKKRAYAEAKISDEALRIEGMLQRLKESIKNNPSTKNFYIKCLYKDFVKLLS